MWLPCVSVLVYNNESRLSVFLVVLYNERHVVCVQLLNSQLGCVETLH